MRVRMDGVTVDINWKHNKLQDNELASHKTVCEVEVCPPQDGISAADFQRATKEAFCSKKDVFSLDKGKKISLARALSAALPGPMNKATRRQVWNEYLGVVYQESE